MLSVRELARAVVFAFMVATVILEMLLVHGLILPLVFLAPHGFRNNLIWLTAHFYCFHLIAATHLFSPIHHRVTVRDEKTLRKFANGYINSERCIIMPNHLTNIDFLVIWFFAHVFRRCGDVKYFLKNSVKKIPVFGLAVSAMNFVSLKRNWAVDREYIKRKLASLQHHPLLLVIFPEGTVICPEMLEKSNSFASTKGFRETKNVMLPRTTGMFATLTQIRDSIDGIYDITMSMKSKDHLNIYYEHSIQNLFFRGIPLNTCHLHVTFYPISAVPASEEEFGEWLRNLYYEKDRLIAEFIEKGSFDGIPVETPSHYSLPVRLYSYFMLVQCIFFWYAVVSVSKYCVRRIFG